MRGKLLKYKAKAALTEYKARLLQMSIYKYHEEGLDVAPALGKLLGLEELVEAERRLWKDYKKWLLQEVKIIRLMALDNRYINVEKLFVKAKINSINTARLVHIMKKSYVPDGLNIFYDPEESPEVKKYIISNFLDHKLSPFFVALVKEAANASLMLHADMHIAAYIAVEHVLSPLIERFPEMDPIAQLIVFDGLVVNKGDNIGIYRILKANPKLNEAFLHVVRDNIERIPDEIRGYFIRHLPQESESKS